MDVRAGGKGSAWKLSIGLAIVCGVLVFAAGFLHREAVASAIDAQQAKSAAYVHGKLTNAVGNEKLTNELGDRATADLKKEADVPAGTDVRIYAMDGTPVFSSGRPAAGDRTAITAAAGGEVGRVVDGSDLAVYVPIEGKGDKPVAVAAVVSDIDAVRADAAGPLDALRMPLLVLGVVLLIAGLVLMVRGGSTRAVAANAQAVATPPKAPKAEVPTKSRVSGFDPAPAIGPAVSGPAPAQGPAPQPASAPVEAEAPARARQRLRLGRKAPKETAVQTSSGEMAATPKVKKSLFGRAPAAAEVPAPADEPASSPMTPDREAAIRRLLEDQLEQLRTKIQTQEEATATATRQLQEELDVATRRADEAEARVGASSDAPASVGPAERDMIERLRSLETELAQAKAAAAEAMAHADELQRAVDAPLPAQAPSGGAGTTDLVEAHARLTTAEQQIEEAQRLAAEAEQRAASNESVRGELEVRVAQLGAKAGELEQKATELETRLREANAGGDAVRAEIASLTAALAGANARVEELESVAAVGASDERDASTAEVTRLRAELASQMERAQSTEDRVATLEADLAAAEQGVGALPDETLEDEPDHSNAMPAQTPEAVTPTVWIAPNPPVTAAPSMTLPQAPNGDDRYGDVWSEPAAEPNPPQESAMPSTPTVTSSLDDEPATPANEATAAADESAGSEDTPAPEDGSVSVEDDLWALRARLAHAADDRETQHTPTDEPRWS